VKTKSALVAALLCTAGAVQSARMVINSYGIPTRIALQAGDRISFQDDGLAVNLTRGETSSRYYLGYINRVTFDTVGGTLGNLSILAAAGTVDSTIAMTDIQSLVLEPSTIDSSDPDGDGIGTFEEYMTMHTDPKKKDSDGDGFDDAKERGNFTASSPRIFNPLIADLPKLSVLMREMPHIFYVYSKGTETAKTRELTSTQKISRENTVTDGYEIKHGYELEIKNSLAFDAGIIPSIESKFEMTNHYTYEDTRTHSSEAKSGYEDERSEMNSLQETKSISISGARLTVPVTLRNNGDRAIALGNLIFGIYADCGSLGELHLGSITTSDASQIRLNAGDSLNLSLSKDYASLDEVDRLGMYANWISVRLDGSSVTEKDENGADHDFTAEMTNVRARCAQVGIDFSHETRPNGSLRKGVQAKVATLTKFNPFAKSASDYYGPVRLGEALATMGVSYTTDSTGQLTSVDGLANDKASKGEWVILCKKEIDGSLDHSGAIYAGTRANPDSIIIHAREAFALKYSRDTDGDSLPDVLEKEYGTFGLSTADFDGDGISDVREVFGWKRLGNDTTWYTNPANADSDRDGLPDATDPNPNFRVKKTSINLRKVSFLSAIGTTGITDTVSLNLTDTVAAGGDRNYTVTASAIGSRPKIVLALDNPASVLLARCNGLAVDSLTTGTATNTYELRLPRTLKFSDDTLVVVVRSDDGMVGKTYRILFDAPLQNRNALPVVGANPDRPWSSFKIDVDLDKARSLDERITGVMVFRSRTGGTLAPVSGKNYAERSTVGDWTLVRKYDIPALNGTQSLIDSGDGMVGGDTIFYRQVPYAITAGGTAYALQGRAVKDTLPYILIAVGQGEVAIPGIQGSLGGTYRNLLRFDRTDFNTGATWNTHMDYSQEYVGTGSTKEWYGWNPNLGGMDLKTYNAGTQTFMSVFAYAPKDSLALNIGIHMRASTNQNFWPNQDGDNWPKELLFKARAQDLVTGHASISEMGSGDMIANSDWFKSQFAGSTAQIPAEFSRAPLIGELRMLFYDGERNNSGFKARMTAFAYIKLSKTLAW
jgi:hypothetical protein